MVLTFNRKMMAETPSEGGFFYENVELEQVTVNGFKGHVLGNGNSLTLNLTNFVSDYGMVPVSQGYRISEKESKGAENLMNGKLRYYPSEYVAASTETATEPAGTLPNGPLGPIS